MMMTSIIMAILMTLDYITKLIKAMHYQIIGGKPL